MKVEICYSHDSIGLEIAEVAVVARNHTKRIGHTLSAEGTIWRYYRIAAARARSDAAGGFAATAGAGREDGRRRVSKCLRMPTCCALRGSAAIPADGSRKAAWNRSIAPLSHRERIGRGARRKSFLRPHQSTTFRETSLSSGRRFTVLLLAFIQCGGRKRT